MLLQSNTRCLHFSTCYVAVCTRICIAPFYLMLAWAPPTYLCNWLLSSRRSLRNRREEGRVSGRSHSFLDLRRVDVDTRGRFFGFSLAHLSSPPLELYQVNREHNYVRCILLSFAARVDRTRGRRPTTRRALEAPKRPII